MRWLNGIAQGCTNSRRSNCVRHSPPLPLRVARLEKVTVPRLAHPHTGSIKCRDSNRLDENCLRCAIDAARKEEREARRSLFA